MEEKGDSVSLLINNNKGVCRTARDTPGLLKYPYGAATPKWLKMVLLVIK